jgi:DNA-directed RNA polymerase subunit RPC12/RpoP
MDPAYFKPGDVALQKCALCGCEVEFWKDDIFLACPVCGTRNMNERVRNTCLAWCREAAACVGSRDIDEWLSLQNDKRKTGKC